VQLRSTTWSPHCFELKARESGLTEPARKDRANARRQRSVWSARAASVPSLRSSRALPVARRDFREQFIVVYARMKPLGEFFPMRPTQ
jgi:hypothetical protein